MSAIRDLLMANQISSEDPSSSVLPEGYVELDYIESSDAYIDTNYFPKASNIIELDCYHKPFTSISFAMGWRWQGAWGTANECSIVCYGKTENNNLIVVGRTRFYNNYKDEIDLHILIDFIEEYKSVNGEVIWEQYKDYQSPFDWSYTSPYSIYLFALNDKGKPYAYGKDFRIKSLKIKDRDNVVRHMIACMSPKGENGMYDIIERKFYGSSNNKNFNGGPETIIK